MGDSYDFQLPGAPGIQALNTHTFMVWLLVPPLYMDHLLPPAH